MNELIQKHKRLIESEAAKYSQFVPNSTALAQAYKIAHKAAESFDPKTGLQFSTHLTNQLKKLSRLSTTYGATVRMPEAKQFRLQRVNMMEKALRDEYGRDPSAQEISEALGWNIAEVSTLLMQRKRDVNVNSLMHSPIFVDNSNDEWVHFVYQELAPRDQVIFEHKTGWGGKKEMTNEELAKKLGVSPATVSNRVKAITSRIQDGWRVHGT